MKYLLSIFVLLIVPFNAIAHEYWVVKVEGKPQVTVSELNKSVAVTLGGFLQSDWQIVSQTSSRVSVMCEDGSIAVIGRNQTPHQVCNRDKTFTTKELTRYRNDEDPRFPKILRPRSEKIINFGSIKWSYEGATDVDIRINNKNSGASKVFRFQTGGKLDYANLSEFVKPGENYSISVCRSGTINLCSDKVLNIVYQMASKNQQEELNFKSESIHAQSGFKNERALHAGLLYLNDYFDDSVDVLSVDPLVGYAWAKYIVGQSYVNTGLLEEAEVYFQVLIDAYLLSKSSDSELIAINSCYSLKAMYNYFEGGYGTVDFLRKKYTSICTVY